MRFFQTLIGFILLMGFMTLLFFIAWYVAIPVLFVLFFLTLLGFFRGERLTLHISPEITRKPSKNERKNENVIDVDYTEIP